MWVSNALFLVAGLVLASRMAFTGGHTRGGGIEGVWQRLFRRKARPQLTPAAEGSA